MLRVSAVVLVALMIAPAQLIAQLPPGTSVLDAGQVESIKAAVEVAEVQIYSMQPNNSPVRTRCRLGIANFKKMLAANRVVNANGRGESRGTAAHTEPEGMNGKGQAVSSSEVGGGTEYICLGEKVSGMAPHSMGAILMHEGMRTKQGGLRTPPPAGSSSSWVPQLSERMARWRDDGEVYEARAAYFNACADLAELTPNVNPEVVQYFRQKAAEAAKVAAENKENVKRAVRGEIK